MDTNSISSDNNMDTNPISSDDNEDDIYGTSGLVNLGNTCYVNSIIQCLSNCNIFRELILSKQLINKLINHDNEYIFAKKKLDNNLSFQLRKIFLNLWNSSFYHFRPISFKKLFGIKINQFQNYNQHDSQEALLCILDTIHEELVTEINIKPIKRNLTFEYLSNLYLNEDKNIDKILKIIKSNPKDYINFKSLKDLKLTHKKYSEINYLFEGRTLRQLTCLETKGIKLNFETFFYLVLSFPNNSSNKLSSESNKSELQSSNNSEIPPDYSDLEFTDDENTNSQYDDTNTEDDDNSHSQYSSCGSNASINEISSDDDSLYGDNSDHKNDIDNDFFKNFIGNSNKKYDLNDLFNHYMKKEILSGDNKWFSPYKNDYVEAEQMNLLWEGPKILIIQIKRFEYSHMGGNKLNNMVEFPIYDLDITPYLHANHSSKYTKYDLFAINNHTNFNNFGFNGLSFGHYYSYCKNYLDNKWYNFNDDDVSEIDEDNLVTNKAYILFYEGKE